MNLRRLFVQRKVMKETGRFTAVSDNGATVTIIEKTTFIEAPTSDGVEWVEGLKRYETARGEFLNVIGPDTFQSPLMAISYRRV